MRPLQIVPQSALARIFIVFVAISDYIRYK